MTDELRKKIYNDLGELLLSAMERGEITLDDSKEAAGFILDRLDTVQTKEDLLIFLEQVKDKWRLFEPVYRTLKAQSTQSEDVQKIQEIQQKLQQFQTA